MATRSKLENYDDVDDDERMHERKNKKVPSMPNNVSRVPVARAPPSKTFDYLHSGKRHSSRRVQRHKGPLPSGEKRTKIEENRWLRSYLFNPLEQLGV